MLDSVKLSIPSPPLSWNVFNLGQWFRDLGWSSFPWNINIHIYAITMLLGIIAAIVITSSRLTKRGAEPGIVLDIALWAVPLGIIGARVYHVLTHPNDYFGAGKNLVAVLYIWDGGIALFGSLIGGAVGVYIGCRMSGIRFWSFADALIPGLLVAQSLGRLGNYFNHELFGLPTNLPWGLQIESTNAAYPVGLPAGTLFHPLFLYEILLNLLGVAVLLFLEKKFSLQWGRTLAVYMIWYGLVRTFLESIRIDPSETILLLPFNELAALVVVVAGIVLLIVQTRRHPGRVPSVYVPGRGWNPPRALDLTDTYSETDDQDDDALVDSAPDDSADGAAAGSGKLATSGVGSS